MEELIREGALRLLTSESSCDVILSCRGYRLMAHKVILSIASPVLQDLLQQHDAVPTVIILPDISVNTMSLILDYIYSGSVNVRPEILTEFITIANELKLQIDTGCMESFKCSKDSIEDRVKPDLKFSMEKFENDEKAIYDVDKCNSNYLNSVRDEGFIQVDNRDRDKPEKKKCTKKIPELLPLTKIKHRKVLYNHITPSPWCPRVSPLLADPRENNLPTGVSNHVNNNIIHRDRNNNLRNKKIIETKLPLGDTSQESNNSTNILRQRISLQRRLQVYNRSDSESDTFSDQSNHVPKTNFHTVDLSVEEKSIAITEIREIDTNAQSDNAKIKVINIHDEESEFVENNGQTPSLKKGEFSSASRRESKKPFNCEDCGKSFSQLRNFKYHRSIHEGTKEFSAKCPECGKTFNDKGYLSSHMKIHKDRKEYGCPHCPKRFNQRVAYNMHLRIHTGVKPHECPTCGKTFSRKMLLKQHQRVHTGERPYSCPECGKSFADRSNMSLHARLHTGVKPYTCNLCSKSFTKKHHLKTHMNFHTGLKPYSCEKCGLAFSQSSNMRTHYKKCILKASDSMETENT